MFNDNFLSIDELKQATKIPGIDGFRSHQFQSLHIIPTVIDKLLEKNKGKGLVILAIDGIRYDIMQQVVGTHYKDKVIPLTSTFPSTSTVAWLTSCTGLMPHQHTIPGVVFLDEHSKTMMNCILQNHGHPTHINTEHVYERENLKSSIFYRLKLKKYITKTFIGALQNYDCPWKDILLHNSDIVYPTKNLLESNLNPLKMYKLFSAEMDAYIKHNAFDLIWSFVDLDSYIHLNGYTASLMETLYNFTLYINDLVSRGYSVLLYSDHGLTENINDKKTLDSWDDICSNIQMSHSPGGAGRVRWLYPDQHAIYSLEDIVDKSNLSFYLCAKETLNTLGLTHNGKIFNDRIGSIVACATNAYFPTVDKNFIFDHGSFTYNEMFVPLMIYPQ